MARNEIGIASRIVVYDEPQLEHMRWIASLWTAGLLMCAGSGWLDALTSDDAPAPWVWRSHRWDAMPARGVRSLDLAGGPDISAMEPLVRFRDRHREDQNRHANPST